MKTIRLACLLLCSVVLIACSGLLQPVTDVSLAPGISLTLQLLTTTLSQTEKIAADYRGEQHTLIMQVEAGPQQVIMAGLTPTGTRLFSVAFDGSTVTSWQSPLFQAPFDGAYVLADFELAALPLGALQQALAGEATLVEHGSGSHRQRELRDNNGSVLIRIEYQDGRTQYCHLLRQYCLLIEAL